MSSLNEVYGDNYHQQAYQSRIDHVLNVVTNNLAQREFVYRLDGCDLLWENDHLSRQTIERLCQRVASLNPQLIVKHINLEDPRQKKILPHLLLNTPVEYFYIIDQEMKKCYIVFITPSQMGAY